MARGYKLGTRRTSQSVFDAEILRMVGLGLNQKEVAGRLKISRWSVDRSLKRSIQSKPEQVEEVKTEGSYQKLRNDSFKGLPEIQKWSDNFKARGIKGYAGFIGTLKQICDELQIYPSMMDLNYGSKYIVSQAGKKSKAQLRQYKVAMRSWLKFSQNTSDNELQVAGLDAKHHSLGKWATVGLSEDQIKHAISILSKSENDKKVLLAFRLGTECCTPSQELRDMKRSDYIATDGILRTYREKTESFWSKYPSQETASLLLSIETEQLFSAEDMDYINKRLQEVFKMIGATSPYFILRPIHSLRHTGAQRILRRTDWNRAVTAVLGGWNSELTLENYYGAVPSAIIHKVGSSIWKDQK